MPSEEGLPLQLPAQAFGDIAQLTKLADHIRNVVATAASLVSTTPFQDYPKAIARTLKVSVDLVGSVISSLRALRRMQQAFDLEAGEFLRRLTTSIQNDATPEWRERCLAGWNQSQQILTEVLKSLGADHPLVLLWKSENLSASYENLLGDAVILTDIRPVFNHVGDKVVQSVVSQTLMIEYYSGQEARRIQFALDATDIKALQEVCKRAKRKSDALKATLVWPTSVPRDTGSSD